MVTERTELYPSRLATHTRPLLAERESDLAGAAAAGAEALDLASLGRRHVVRAAAHLTHEPLLLYLAPELPKSLFELLRVLDYDSHNPERIPENRPG